MSLSFRFGRRAAGLLLLTTATLAVGPAANAATAEPDLSGGCTDGVGVTVVVDLTELGGGVEVGCAPTAATGTEALAAAGFTETRDASGLICAIEGAPDPCPAEFTGSWWTYWYAAADGEWQSYMEGPDTAVPQPGAYEGWRYGDGTSAPAATPADVAGAAAAEPEPEPTDEAQASASPTTAAGDEDAELAVTEADDAAEGTPAWVMAAVGVAALAALAAVVVGLRRRRGDLMGPPGQD